MNDRTKRILMIAGAVLIIAGIVIAAIFISTANNNYPNDVESGEPAVSYEVPPQLSESELGTLPNRVEISANLSDVIFNAQFLQVPTYEGSGQLVHPQVLFFEDGFAGFYYLMTFTPYPFFDASHENPSIVGSQDGINWVVPDGLTNPVVGAPEDVARGGHFSDPVMVINGDMLELWWRRSVVRVWEDGRFEQDGLHNRIYRKTTTDLINWTEREIIFDSPYGANHYVSPAVFRDENGLYRVWYVNYDLRFYVIESYDLLEWTQREEIFLTLGEWGLWHHEINFVNGRFEGLFTSLERAGEPDWTPVEKPHRLFHVYSDDGLTFSVGSQILIEQISPELQGMTIHKSSFVLRDGIYQMYFAMYDQSRHWHTFYFEIAEENLYRLFGD